MRNPKIFTRQAVQEVASDGFARRKTNAVHKAVKSGPVLSQVFEQVVDLCIVAHVTVKNQLGVEVGGKLGDPILESLAYIAESQLSTLRVTGLGNAVSDGTV